MSFYVIIHTSCSGQTSGWWCNVSIDIATFILAGITTSPTFNGDVRIREIVGTGGTILNDSFKNAVNFGIACKSSLKHQMFRVQYRKLKNVLLINDYLRNKNGV